MWISVNTSRAGRLRAAIPEVPGYSAGGCTFGVEATTRVHGRMSHVRTSGGGRVRFLSRQALPVVEVLRRAARTYAER